jgi:hypothetical protein
MFTPDRLVTPERGKAKQSKRVSLVELVTMVSTVVRLAIDVAQRISPKAIPKGNSIGQM